MTTVHASPDYAILPQGSPPPGYPSLPTPDTFTNTLDDADFPARRGAFLAHVLRNLAPHNTKAVWYELARLAAGGRPHEGVIFSTLAFIAARKDCADFALHSILRLLYQFTPRRGEEGTTFSSELFARARQTVLAFKYFPDEPGIDSLCTWTENHYILFSSAAYLAGQLYPGEIFTNSGETGEQKMALNRPRILRWLELRFRSGFSEWLSHVYYDEDLTALLSLVDFCQDAEIAIKASMVVDLLLLDIALNSYRGVFGSTHGRSYVNTKKWASNEATSDTGKLLFGMGQYSAFDNMSAAAFALSTRYLLPPAILAIAQDHQQSFVNCQRMGIRMAEAERWGLGFDSIEDGMHFLTLEAYVHPRSIALTMRMFDAFHWWQNAFFAPFAPFEALFKSLRCLRLLAPLARLIERDACRNTREEVNIYTYRTPDYLLSCAQDYRKGYGGDQQHIWQATLGANAVCFTTHPARLQGASPNYWTGSGLLPRAAQVQNVIIVIYRLEKIPALYVPTRLFFTHAWLPKDQFDEVVERAGWVFARKGDGYLALRSQQPYRWRSALQPGSFPITPFAEEDNERELIAEGAHNIWICELGRRADNGPFAEFMDGICVARLEYAPLRVRYHSPSQGWLEFGWDGPFKHNGNELALHGYPRYTNPYVQADFPSAAIHIQAGGYSLLLDWLDQTRKLT